MQVGPPLRSFLPVSLLCGFVNLAPILKTAANRGTFRTIAIAVMPLVMAAFIIAPVWLSQAIGPAGVLFLFAIGLSSVLCVLSRASDYLRLPVVAIVILVAVVFSLLDLTDNHVVAQSPVAASDMHATPTDAFTGWAQSLRASDGIRAMLASRAAHGELPKRRSEKLKTKNWRHSAVRLDRKEDEFTLGWILLQRCLDEIACHVWDDETCDAIKVRLSHTMLHNRCIIDKLRQGVPTSVCLRRGGKQAY